MEDPVGRLGRWVLELQQRDFEVRHRVGAKDYVTDALSGGLEDEEIVAFQESGDPCYLNKF